MSDNGNIYITISDTRNGDGGGSPTEPKEKKSAKQKEYDYVKHLALDFLKSKTKEIVNSGISSIGNFTGNYQAQREIQTTVNNVNKLAGIGLATLAGAKYGAVGAIAGFTIGLASTIISDTLQVINLNKQISNQNMEMEQLRQRAGLSSLTNGGRTG